MKKRVDILNLQSCLPNKDVIKMVLSMLTGLDREMVLLAHNTKRKFDAEMWLKKTKFSKEYFTVIRFILELRDYKTLHCLGLFNKKLCSIAARYGDFDSLKWLRRIGCKWKSKKVCIYLARGGHTDMLLWARKEQNCEWSEACYINAIKGGHFETFKMLFAYECPYDYVKCKNLATKLNRWNFVKLLKIVHILLTKERSRKNVVLEYGRTTEWIFFVLVSDDNNNLFRKQVLQYVDKLAKTEISVEDLIPIARQYLEHSVLKSGIAFKMYLLGILYSDYTPQDMQKACIWYCEAVRLGDTGAKRALRDISNGEFAYCIFENSFCTKVYINM